MPLIVAERMTAHIEGEIVVFLIGMRINRLWKVHKWLPVARAMPRMLAELAAAPEHGFAVGSGGDVGIRHETYRFGPGDYECIYNNMPLFGLAKATAAVPASGRFESAGGRMREGPADRADPPAQH